MCVCVCVCVCVYLTKRERLYAGVHIYENCSTQEARYMAEQEAASFDVSEAEENVKKVGGERWKEIATSASLFLPVNETAST